jgi:hemolysin III
MNADPPPGPPLRPRLRGVLHQWGFVASLPLGAAVVIAAPGARATVAAGVYALSVAALLGTSALYHRVTWSPRVRRWMRRLDHSMIFVLIAGTYTPFCILVLPPSLGTPLLTAVWTGALLGVCFTAFWVDAPKPLLATLCIALGWVAIAAMPAIAERAGAGALALLAGGGLAYTAGALVYARGRPDPWPSVFGYHEVFHALVLVAALLHFAAVAGYALPEG